MNALSFQRSVTTTLLALSITVLATLFPSRVTSQLIGFQLGLQLRSTRYDLTQTSHIEGSTRNQRESWMEWTPSWGLHFGMAEFDLRYRGRLITGTGRPGVARTGVAELDFVSAEADFLPAPEGPLTLQDAWVMTHQISVSMPIR